MAKNVVYLKCSIDDTDFYRIIGLNSSKIIATATLYINTRKKIEDAAHLTGVFVSPEHRGQGWGKALVKKAILLAQDESKDLLVLQVHQCNLSARKLYTSTGFTEYESTNEEGFISLYMILQNKDNGKA